MEGIVLGTPVFESAVTFAGGLILLAVVLGAVLLGYIADEEAKGRRIDWFEEPLAMAGEPEQLEEVKLGRAA